MHFMWRHIISCMLLVCHVAAHKEKDKSAASAATPAAAAAPAATPAGAAAKPGSADKSKGACASGQEPECVDWCSAGAADAHCTICACEGCGFCEAIQRLHAVAACVPHDAHGM